MGADRGPHSACARQEGGPAAELDAGHSVSGVCGNMDRRAHGRGPTCHANVLVFGLLHPVVQVDVVGLQMVIPSHEVLSGNKIRLTVLNLH